MHPAPIIMQGLIPNSSRIFITTKLVGMTRIKNKSTHILTARTFTSNRSERIAAIGENPIITKAAAIKLSAYQKSKNHL